MVSNSLLFIDRPFSSMVWVEIYHYSDVSTAFCRFQTSEKNFAAPLEITLSQIISAHLCMLNFTLINQFSAIVVYQSFGWLSFRENDPSNQNIFTRVFREVVEIDDVKNNPLCTERRIKGKDIHTVLCDLVMLLVCSL